MKNVQMNVKGTILTITVDLSKSQGDSKTGNSEIIGTTSGNTNVPGTDDIKIGLNVYKPK